MKKCYFPFLLLVVTLAGCAVSEVESDVDDLKARVEALEKSKSVIGVSFSDTQMVLTFSTSETQSIDMPTGLNGLDGEVGNGIKSIAYNETTSVLTIVLSNGQESQFRIITGTQGLAAVLISDINGSMYLSEATMGALPVAIVSYDEKFNITSLLSKNVVDGAVMNNFDITKQYTNSLLTNVQTRTYATRKEVKYVRENYDLNGDGVPDDVEIGVLEQLVIKSSESSFSLYNYLTYELNQDGTYTCVTYQDPEIYNIEADSETGQYIYTYKNVHYHKFLNVVKKTFTSYPENNWGYHYGWEYYGWSYFEKDGENSVIYYSAIRDVKTIVVDGVTHYELWYARYGKLTKTGTYQIGDVLRTENNQIECNAAGRPLKIYSVVEGSSVTNRYVQLSYNDAGYVIRGDEYNKLGENWVVNPIYLTFEYNASNLLTSVKRNFADGKTDEMVKNVYDKNGNPVEIYAWGGEILSNYGWYDQCFDPFTNTDTPWQNNVVVPEGLQLVAKVQYDYACKNFFGNSIGAVMPELQNYKVYNAPVKISHAQSADYLWVEYAGFNESGYPEMLNVNSYSNGNTYQLQFDLKYIKK